MCIYLSEPAKWTPTIFFLRREGKAPCLKTRLMPKNDTDLNHDVLNTFHKS